MAQLLSEEDFADSAPAAVLSESDFADSGEPGQVLSESDFADSPGQDKGSDLRKRLKQKDSLLNKIGYVKNRTKEDKPDAEGLTLDDYRNFVTSSDFNTLDEERLNLVAQAVDAKHADVSKKRGFGRIIMDAGARGFQRAVDMDRASNFVGKKVDQESRDARQALVDVEDETEIAHPRSVGSVKNIRGVGDAVTMAAESMAENLPNMLMPVASSIAGAKAGGAIGATAGPAGALAGATIGAMGGGFLGGLRMNVGEAVMDQTREGLELNRGLALGQGIGYSLLDMGGAEVAASRRIARGTLAVPLREAKKEFVASIGKLAKTIGKDMFREGWTEAAQSGVVGNTRRKIQTGSFTEPGKTPGDLVWNALDEAYGGAFAGGGMSMVTTGYQYAGNKKMVKHADAEISRMAQDTDIAKLDPYDRVILAKTRVNMAVRADVESSLSDIEGTRKQMVDDFLASKQAQKMTESERLDHVDKNLSSEAIRDNLTKTIENIDKYDVEARDTLGGTAKTVLNAYESEFSNMSIDDVPADYKSDFDSSEISGMRDSKIIEPDGSETYKGPKTDIMIEGRPGAYSIRNNNGMKMPIGESGVVDTLEEAVAFASKLARFNQYRIDNNASKAAFIKGVAEKSHPGANVVQVDSPKQIKDPEARARMVGGEQAFYNPKDNTVYAMLDSIQNPAQAEIMLQHEDTHRALIEMMTKEGLIQPGESIDSAKRRFFGTNTSRGAERSEESVAKANERGGADRNGLEKFRDVAQRWISKKTGMKSIMGDAELRLLLDKLNAISKQGTGGTVSYNPEGASDANKLRYQDSFYGQGTLEEQAQRQNESATDAPVSQKRVINRDTKRAGLVDGMNQPVEPSTVVEKPSVPQETDRPTRHRVFEGGSPITVSNPNALRATDTTKAYRLTNQSQVDDMLDTGGVRAREGKMKGGHTGEVHWSAGHDTLGYNPSDGKYVIETDYSNLNEREGMLPNSAVRLWKVESGKWVDVTNMLAPKRESTTASTVRSFVKTELRIDRIKEKHGDLFNQAMDVTDGDEQAATGLVSEWLAGQNIADKSIPDSVRVASKLEQKADLTAKDADTLEQNAIFGKDLFLFGYRKDKQTGSWKFQEPAQETDQEPPQSTPVEPVTSEPVVTEKPVETPTATPIDKARQEAGLPVNVKPDLVSQVASPAPVDKVNPVVEPKNDGELFGGKVMPFNLDGGTQEDVVRIAAEKKADEDRQAEAKRKLDAAPVLPMDGNPVVATVLSKKGDKVSTSPERVQETPKTEQLRKTEQFKRGTKIATTRNADGVSYFGEVLQSNPDGTVKIRAFKEKTKGTIGAKGYGVDSKGNQVTKDIDVPAESVKSVDATADTSKLTDAERRKLKMAERIDAANADNELRKGSAGAAPDIVDKFNDSKERKEQRKTDNGNVMFRHAIADKGYFEASNALVTKPGEVRFRRAYHGSPHLFDKFNIGKIGTGEGNEAYGWGLYYADSVKVAEQYRKQLSKEYGFSYSAYDNMTRQDVVSLVNKRYGSNYLDGVIRMGGVADRVMDDLQQGAKENPYPKNSDRYEAYEDLWNRTKWNGDVGALYEVEIDAEDNELLDLDKPLSEQSDVIQRASMLAISKYRDANRFLAEPVNPLKGLSFYIELGEALAPNQMKAGAKAASEYLSSIGIKGIKYADQMSRTGDYKASRIWENEKHPERPQWRVSSNRGVMETFMTEDEAKEEARRLTEESRTYNYVIFDDKLIKITKRNDQEAKGYDEDGGVRFRRSVDSGDKRGYTGGMDTKRTAAEETDVRSALAKRGIRGDDLENAIDLMNDLSEKGGLITPDARAVLFHRTTPENVAEIIKRQSMTSKEDGLFFGTKPEGQIDGYGTAVVEVELPLERLELNDVFSEEAHVRMPTGSIGRMVPVTAREVSQGTPMFRRSTVTPEQDAAYLDAVQKGDMKTAQRMVDEAAKAVGYDRETFRGDSMPDDIVVYDPKERREVGIFTTTVREIADVYANKGGRLSNASRRFYVRAPKVLDLTKDNLSTMRWVAKWAESFDEWIDRQTGEEVSAFDILQSGLMFDYEGDWSSERWMDLQATAEIEGYDAVVLPDYDSELGVFPSLVVFDSKNLKLADPITRDDSGRVIPLSARFNEETPDIRFRRSMAGTPSGADILDTETGLQAARRIVQDYMQPWERKQESLQKTLKRKLSDDVDVYRAEDRSYGLIRNGVHQFEKNFIDKAENVLNENGLTVDEFDQFLMAKAGPDRNKMIADRTEGKNLTGSGQSDVYWNNILAAYRKQGKYDKLNEAAEHVWELNRAVLDMKVEAGLMSKAQADVWKTKSPFYVPLRSDDAEADYKELGKRASFSLKRKESKSATGRMEGHEADTPFAFSVLQALEAVGRANKNKVYETAAKLIEQNPSDLWHIEKRIPTKHAYDADTGKVISVPDAQFEDAPNVVIVKRDGKKQYLVFEGADGLKLARSLKKDSLQKAPAMVSALTRTYAMMRTAMVPTFILRNLRADILQLAINMTSEAKSGMVPEVFKSIPSAWKAVYTYERDGKAKGALAGYANEFFSNGGKIAGVGVQTVDKINQTLNRHVKKHGKFMTHVGMPALSGVEYIERLNASIETGTRIALYTAMRKRGFSIRDSIEAAKNITVNFNRKGELGPYVNSFYMFSNVAVQDAARSVKAITGKNGRAVVLGLLGAGFLGAMLNNGDDDEEDKTGAGNYKNIPESDKRRNIIIKVGGKYIKQPIRGIWAWIYYAGTKAGDVAFGKYDSARAAVDVSAAALDTINFLGASGSVTQFMMPTIVDPFIQHGENRDWKGSPIYQRKFTEAQPDSSTGMKRTPNWMKSTAKGLNRLTGGDDATKGMIDVAPETIKFVIDTMAGGIGTDLSYGTSFVADAAKGEFDVDKTPVVRDAIRDLPDSTSEYYRAKDRFDAGVYAVNHYKTAKERSAYYRENPFMKPSLAERIKNLNKTIKELREKESKTDNADRKKILEARRLRLQSTVLRLMSDGASK